MLIWHWCSRADSSLIIIRSESKLLFWLSSSDRTANYYFDYCLQIILIVITTLSFWLLSSDRTAHYYFYYNQIGQHIIILVIIRPDSKLLFWLSSSDRTAHCRRGDRQVAIRVRLQCQQQPTLITPGKPVWLSVCFSDGQRGCQTVCPVWLSVRMSVCLLSSFFLSVWLAYCLSVWLSDCPTF